MWLDPTRTTINRVRITGEREESQALALRSERLLATAQLDVNSLSPAAILVVRTLRDPLPGKWRLPRSGEAHAPPLWQQAVTTALDQAARSADRPIDGAVAVTAQAVLFADPAEVLACLALDWLEGSLVSRWWWQSLLGVTLRQGATPALVSAWLKTAHAIPAALHLLAQRQAARSFVQALSGETAQTLVVAVAEAFGLVDSHLAIKAIDSSWQQVTATETAGQIAPWLPWTPEAAPPGLSQPQILLLGIGLGLERSPAVVRSAAFAREVAAWIAVTSSLSTVAGNPGQAAHVLDPSPFIAVPSGRRVQDETPQSPQDPFAVSRTLPHPGRLSDQSPAARKSLRTEQPSEQAYGGQATSDSDPGLPSASTTGWAVGSEPATQTDAGTAAGTARLGDDVSNDLFSQAAAGPIPISELGLPNEDAGAVPAPRTELGMAPEPAEMWPPAIVEPFEVVLTGYGGVFYLVNLGLYLGLYGDFSAPLQPGLDLSIYDFVALVAAGLCPDESTLLADPVWPLLARLAGRSAEDPPGAGFAPPDGLSLAEWLDLLLATLRERLHRALGTSDEDPPELCRLLLAQPARVLVTSTRLDVFFALDEHPIPIRLSGLDRDPGWVPAAGRVVAFHYE